MNFFESIRLAIGSLLQNKLRAFLTLLGIAIGVFAIMGAGTLTSSLKYAVSDQLAAIGETVFWIEKMPHMGMGNNFRKYRNRKPITYSQFKDLKRQMTTTSMLSAYTVSMSHTIKSGNLTTNPDVYMIGADYNFFSNNAYNVEFGRPLTDEDVNMTKNVAIIGNDVAVKLFPNLNPLDKYITIKNQTFQIVGILEVKGAMLGQSKDNMVIIPITNLLQYFADEWEESLSISIKAVSKEMIPATIDETIGALRVIRKVQPWEENSFELTTNESISEQFGSFVSFLSAIGWISGGFALIAAGVGIMNIMLVSVKERTREIGVRKAVGAKRKWILMQFIVETVTICQIGCFFGMAMGFAGAKLLGKLININTIFPIGWLIGSIVICTMLGVIFGAYPAWRASNLDPIDALRYE